MAADRLLGEGGTRMVCAGEVSRKGILPAIRCEKCGRVWVVEKAPILRRCPCGAFLSNNPRMVKRGYSREFTPRSERRVKIEIDRVPPTLADALKAKAKREGISIRALTLQLWKKWVAAHAAPSDPPAAVPQQELER